MTQTRPRGRRRGLSGRARLAGVMGWPVAHSLSPRLHGYWLDRLGIDGAYLPLAVPPERLADAVRALPALGFAGANVTVPHKEAVLPLLDGLSETARRIGAVNTLTVTTSGEILGDNTDAEGFLCALEEAAGTVAGRRVLMLGAGGAARAVAVALVGAGVSQVTIANRGRERAEALAADLQDLAVPVALTAWLPGPDVLAEADLLVNTTSLGMAGGRPLELDLEPMPHTAVVCDIVYRPLETDLLAQARARGLTAVDGLGMLLHQAVPGFETWFGARPKVTRGLRNHLLAALDAEE